MTPEQKVMPPIRQEIVTLEDNFYAGPKFTNPAKGITETSFIKVGIEVYDQTFNGEKHRHIAFKLSSLDQKILVTTVFGFLDPADCTKACQLLLDELAEYNHTQVSAMHYNEMTATELFDLLSRFGTPSQQLHF